MKKIICIGTQETHSGLGRVYCKITIEDGNLSITGVIGPLASGNAKGNCGQIQEGIQPIYKFEPGWDGHLVEQFIKMWNRWHLNNMNAGCTHQKEWYFDKKIKTVTVDTDLWRIKAGEGKSFLMSAIDWASDTMKRKNRMRDNHVKNGAKWYRPKFVARPERTTPIFNLYYNIKAAAYVNEVYEAKSDWERSWYGEGRPISVKVKEDRAGGTRHYNHPEGLLCKPCLECGYKYGTEWLKEELPAEVIEFLESLPDSEYQPAWV